MTPPLLWHFPISHYAEKARWALDWKGLPHERQVLSASYLPRAWWATGRAKIPVLHLDGRSIGDSTAIIAALELHQPDPPLYPDDLADRGRALEIEDWFDEEVGHPVRTLIVGPLMEESSPERVAEVMMSGMKPAVKRSFALMAPVFSRFYFWRHGIHAGSRRDAPDLVRRALDRVAQEAMPEGYFVGGRFSVADLTAAALLAPIARPAGTVWAEIGEMPASVEPFLEESAMHPGTAWVREIYARHREGG